MTWLSTIPGSTVALCAAIAAALTVIAYILKMRRRRFEVPFSTLWQRVLEQRDASSLWKQLKRLLSLALALAILALLFVAMMGPTLGLRDDRARTVIVLLDASASMKATDGDAARPGLTRMARAKERALELVDSLGGGDLAMVMRVDGQATPLSRFDSDKPMLRKIIAGVEAADTPADLPRALSAAADALRGRQRPMIVIISDGAYAQQDRDRVSWGDGDRASDLGPPASAQSTTTNATTSASTTTTTTTTTTAAGSAAGSGSAPAADADEDAEARKKSFADAQLASIDLSGIDVHYLGVGSRTDNVGIVAFNVRRYIANKAAYEVFIEVQNFGSEPAHRQLALYNGESAIEVKPIDLAPGQRLREIVRELPGGESRLRASLRPVAGPGGSDPFPLDDEAWALLPARKKQVVLLVTRDNLYLEGAMLVYDNIEVFKATPEEYDAAPARTIVANPATGRLYDAVVFDDHTPVVMPPPPVNLIYFHPTGEHSPIAIRGTLPRPRITELADDHPVMRWVQLADANFDASDIFAPDRSKGETWLAESVREPIIAARREPGRKLVAFGFSLAGTDLVLRVGFPLLLVNTLDWFAGDDVDLATTYTAGKRLRIPLDGVAGLREVTVVEPGGARRQAPVVEGHATFYGAHVGIHQIIAYEPEPQDAAGAPRGPVTVGIGTITGNFADTITLPATDAIETRKPLAGLELAVNLGSPTESTIAPATDLTLSGKALAAPPAFAITARRELWVYLVLAALALLGLEWITYHRRITV
jgi:hypothetical protein